MSVSDPQDKAEAKAQELKTAAIAVYELVRDDRHSDRALISTHNLCQLAKRYLNFIRKFKTFVSESELDLVGTQLFNAALRQRHDPTIDADLTCHRE